MGKADFRKLLRAALATVAAGLCLFFAKALLAEEETLKEIFDVWIKREVATSSVKFVMTENYITGKGTIGGGPPRDIETKLRRVVVLEGENMRHERAGDVWGLGRVEPYSRLAVNDGDRSKNLTVNALYSVGRTENQPQHDDVKSACLRPILWHYRPLAPKFGVFAIGKLKIVSRKEMLDGTRCILLEEPTEFPGRVWRYWVAPDKEMAVIRRVLVEGAIVRDQTDVTFKRDPKHGWMPSSWKTVHFKRKTGETFSAAKLAVVESDVNYAVPAGTFDIVFPPKTKVFDLIGRETYRVKPDGSKQVLKSWPPVPKERRKSGDGKSTTRPLPKTRSKGVE